MSFALSLQQLGEVGAKITYKASRVGALIWAEEDSTAKILNELLPELTQSLEARGLEISFLRVRHGALSQSAKSSGEFLDDVL